MVTTLLACTASFSIDPDQRDAAGVVADGVDGVAVLETVTDIVAAHADDEPVPCSGEPTDVVCNVTHEMARAVIQSRFEALGYDVLLQETSDDGYDVVNLAVEIAGTDREVVLVGAHYDAGFAAADDNTTGVSVVLELARILQGTTPQHTIRLVTFDLEELGLLGSAAYVRETDLDDVVAMINVDGVGFSSPEQPTSPIIPNRSSGDFVVVVGNKPSEDLVATAHLLAAELDIVPVEAVVAGGDGTGPVLGLFGVASSDHAPFWVARVPAIAFSDTQPTRDPAYHSADDTVDHLDPIFLEQSTRLVVATTAYLARVTP